jgi:hypothetical protein
MKMILPVELLQGLQGECFHDFSQSCRTGLAKHTYAKPVRLDRHRRPVPLCHSPSGRADGNFSKERLKIFVEKGEVEQM